MDIPPDLIDQSSSNKGEGIVIAMPEKGAGNSSNKEYVVQYGESDLELTTPGKGTFTHNDPTNGSVNASIIYPDNSDFANAESFSHWDSHMTPGTHHANDQTGGENLRVKIMPIHGGGDPISANKIEITPGSGNAVEFELFFDTYEDKKSVKPEIHTLLQWLGMQGDKNSRVKVQFFWDRDGKRMDVDVNTGRVKFTMFLTDGSPCRATCSFRGKFHDKSDNALLNSPSKTSDTPIFFNTDIGPETLQFIQGNQFDGALLSDPVFADRERELRTALKQNASSLVVRGLDKSHRLNDVVVRGWDPNNKTAVVNSNPANNLSVEIEGVFVPGVHSVEGLEHVNGVIEYQDGDDMTSHTRPGRQKPGVIKITRDFTSTKEWYNWRQSVVNGKTERKSISIIFHNDAGEEDRSYNLYDCFPTEYVEPSPDERNSGHATETIKISYESMDVQPTVVHYTGDLKTATGAMSQSAQQMTLLLPTTVGGIKGEVMLIGLLMPPQSASPLPPNTTDKSNVNADLSGWKWQAYVTDNSGSDLGDASGNGGEKSAADKRSYTAGHFALELDGVNSGLVQSVEGGYATSDVAGDDNDPKRHHPGDDITLSGGIGLGKSMYDWIKSSMDQKHTRKDGAIIAADYNYKELSRLNFYNGLITEIGFPALDAASKDAAKMTIKISPEQVKQVKSDSAKKTPDSFDATKQKAWLPSNFRLKIDGLEEPCSKVNRVEPIVIKQNNADAGKIEFPQLIITLPESNTEGFYKWNDEIKGKNKQSSLKNGTLDYLDESGSPLFTLTFHNLNIFKITPEKVESSNDRIRRVKFEMYIEEIKFDYQGTATKGTNDREK